MPARDWTNPHREWFSSRVDCSPNSQNAISEFLQLDKSGLSRRLTGEIEFKPRELIFLAGLFMEDAGEVTRRAALLRDAWEKRRTPR